MDGKARGGGVVDFAEGALNRGADMDFGVLVLRLSSIEHECEGTRQLTCIKLLGFWNMRSHGMQYRGEWEALACCLRALSV